MPGLIVSLAGNLAMVALFISGWTHMRHWVHTRPRRHRPIIFGVVMGFGAVTSMVMSVPLQPGIFVDLRATLLAVAAYMGGPYAATISCIIALTYRLAVGGAGAWIGAAAIVLATITGLALGAARKRCQPTRREVVLLGLVVSGINSLTIMTLLTKVATPTLVEVGGMIALLNFLGTTLSCTAILKSYRAAQERDLLVLGIAQSPDFTYIKSANSEFAAVNHAVANLHGFRDPSELIGKTDFDLAPPDRARELFDAEQKLVAGGINPRMGRTFAG